MSVSPISPKANEQYTEFVSRAHVALKESVPNVYKRNEAVWDAWDSRKGQSLRQRAKEYFPPDKYRFVERVPYFMEHVIHKASGPLVYGFKELANMVNYLNDRCQSDSYSALVSHHTDDRLKGPDKEPNVLGYSGPYHLGMVPTAEGDKWGIFGDEHHDRQYANVLDTRRRRSVEVLRPRNGDPAYFDPIATLGADSPRLPLPVARYEAAEEVEVERVGVYSLDFTDRERYMMGGAFSAVGQGNTFVPGGVQMKDRYEGYGSPNQPMPEQSLTGTGMSQLTPDDIQKIVAGLMATPPMQWVLQQMESQGPGQMMGAPPAPQQPAPMPQEPISIPPGPSIGQGGMAMSQYQADGQEDDEVKPEQYAAVENELIEVNERYSQLHSSHQQLADAHDRLFKQHTDLLERFSAQQSKLVDADRYSAIQALHEKYDAVDVIEESKRCLYSQGSKMNDEEFRSHLETVERYAAIAASRPPQGMIPDGTLPTKPVDLEAERRIAEKTVERYTQYAQKNVYKDHEEIRAEVIRELGFAQ